MSNQRYIGDLLKQYDYKELFVNFAIEQGFEKVIPNCFLFPSSKNDTEIMEEKIIKTFIKILPIEYFTFDIKDETIVKIYFYFKLAKICFLEFIFKQFYEFIQQPMIDIEERTIGNLLKIIVIDVFEQTKNK